MEPGLRLGRDVRQLRPNPN